MKTRPLLAVALLAVTGCATDGAVRLARCVVETADQMAASSAEEARRDCRLGVGAGSGVVVFAEEPTPASSRLLAAGLTEEDLGTIASLDFGSPPNERINVLPAGRRPRASRTTYHRRRVVVPELLVCRTRGDYVTIELRDAGNRIEWVGLAE